MFAQDLLTYMYICMCLNAFVLYCKDFSMPQCASYVGGVKQLFVQFLITNWFWDYLLAIVTWYQSQHVLGSKPRRAKKCHMLCVCAGASAQGKKAPCRIVVLCTRMFGVRMVPQKGGVGGIK